MLLQLVIQPLPVLETSESKRLFEDLEANSKVGFLLETELQRLLVALHHEPHDLLSAPEVGVPHDGVDTVDSTIVETLIKVLLEQSCPSILS